MFFEIITNFTPNILDQIVTNNCAHTQHFVRIFQKFRQIFRKNSLKFWQIYPNVFYKFFQKYSRFSINKYYCQYFCFFYGRFTYCSKNWVTISCKFFNIFLKKIKTICYTCYILTLKFLYISFKIAVVRAKNLPLFSTNWKFSHMCSTNFVKFSLFLWNFIKVFPQLIQNFSSFPEYCFKIFTLKICLNIG